MARIPLIDADDSATPPDTKAFMQEAAQAGGGFLYNIFRAMANRPAVGRSFLTLAGTVYFGGTMEPKLGEFAYLTATVVNNCFY